jgi:hypothetical protein
MRLPLIWLWRLLLGGFALAYLASATLQLWLPPLVPFLAAVAVEAQFFVSGLRSHGSPRSAGTDRGPQARDLADFGWASRTVTVRRGDAELVLRPGEMTDEEIADWLSFHDDELDALGPGQHELAAILEPASPVGRYVPPPPAPRSAQIRRRLVHVAIVLAVFAGVLLLERSTPSWQKLSATTRAATLSALGREATRIAGHPAEVICDVSGRHVGYVQDADGLAEIGGHRLWLTPGICYQLYTIRHTQRSSGPSSGHAIAVLAHEAWHLKGERDEAITNCYAYQSGVRVGRALGLSTSTARQLMHEQLADNPADFAGDPGYIVPPGCHKGGSLDLGYDGSHFP